MNHRINQRPLALISGFQKVVGADTYDFYYNMKWQAVVEFKNGAANRLNLFSAEYIDTLAVTVTATARHFYTHDANYNVTCAITPSASVAERYSYSPYGKVTIRDANFSADADGNSDIGNEFLFTGRRLDAETGFYYFRLRYYHAELGRFVNRDPIVYNGSRWNLFEFTNGQPIHFIDPYGTFATTGTLGLWELIFGSGAVVSTGGTLLAVGLVAYVGYKLLEVIIDTIEETETLPIEFPLPENDTDTPRIVDWVGDDLDDETDPKKKCKNGTWLVGRCKPRGIVKTWCPDKTLYRTGETRGIAQERSLKTLPAGCHGSEGTHYGHCNAFICKKRRWVRIE